MNGRFYKRPRGQRRAIPLKKYNTFGFRFVYNEDIGFLIIRCPWSISNACIVTFYLKNEYASDPEGNRTTDVRFYWKEEVLEL